MAFTMVLHELSLRERADHVCLDMRVCVPLYVNLMYALIHNLDMRACKLFYVAAESFKRCANPLTATREWSPVHCTRYDFAVTLKDDIDLGPILTQQGAGKFRCTEVPGRMLIAHPTHHLDHV